MYKAVGAVSDSSHPISALHKCHSYAHNFTVSAKCPSEKQTSSHWSPEILCIDSPWL